ncbi:hypothetical protein HNV12_04910 [Methanococcoides sp. SA1]|nr:hypothetical protein [Methanococcoides sp. SA1]
MSKTKLLCIILLIIATLFSQGKVYQGPDDPAGDIAAERDGYMTGNRVHLYFRNTTELSDWPRTDASYWPSTYEGTRTLDGIGLLVSARVYVANDSIPVDDINEIQSRSDLDTLYFCQTSYRQHMDTDPTGTIEWGFYPVFGYFDENSEYPAMSNRENSWPGIGWPSTGSQVKWPGEWNGRFGRGVKYADLETYFVVNDAHDQEYLGLEDNIKYYPKPGKYIGDKKSDVSIQNGKPWGGLGLRVSQRGFQWNNPQARDAIFWEYSIANISDYDLPEVAFGYWVDTWIGGEDASDDVGFFDSYIDMAYCWDADGIGFGGRQTGTLGFAYLESPGIPYDGKDNDEDGLIDELRDNEAIAKIGPYDGINDLTKFLEFYKMSEEELQEHWDADEDQDWMDGFDANGNGRYDPGENAGDDLGLDGVGPGDLNYNGPDEGECNHRPDYVQGVGCEPNFNATDVSESDMLGLTSFRLFNIPNENACYQWFCGDQSMWNLIGNPALVAWSGSLSNLILTFASGSFPLYQGHEEHISMSELHSYDPLAGLNSSTHNAPALFEQKRIVQVIYEKDYRFAQPPKMPTLTAKAGDGKVILTWDDVSDRLTKDPFVGNINDFEGYKLFRATDKKFSDPQIITDGYGTKSTLKPLFQCDKIDGISGFAEFGHVNGMLYYLGDESGLVHHYVDEEVQNGVTYYYALVAYDYGIEDIGISPSENRIVLELDENEDVRFFGQNVQIVTPRKEAAGYVPPEIELVQNDIQLGCGTVTPEILSNDALKTDHEYKVKFDVDTVSIVKGHDKGLKYATSGYSVYDVTLGDTLVYSENGFNQTGQNIMYNDTSNHYYINNVREITSDNFDGMRLRIDLPVITAKYDDENSDWIQGSAPINVIQSSTESVFFPWQYNIIFTDNPSEYTGITSSDRRVRDENGKSRLSNLLLNQNFNFYVINKSFVDSTGQYEVLDLVVQDMNDDDEYNILEDRVLCGHLTETGTWAGTAFIIEFADAESEEDLPMNGDIYQIDYKRPFFITDSIMFKVKPQDALDNDALKNSLKNVRVVPNPYIATNMMEPAVSNMFLNQRRRIMFTNIPAKCEINIFTSSGIFVKKIMVDNTEDNGIIHWDLKSRENLDVAAGIYYYHIKSTLTKDEKMGKFAIVK